VFNKKLLGRVGGWCVWFYKSIEGLRRGWLEFLVAVEGGFVVVSLVKGYMKWGSNMVKKRRDLKEGRYEEIFYLE
jgi:hypothetical protein